MKADGEGGKREREREGGREGGREGERVSGRERERATHRGRERGGETEAGRRAPAHPPASLTCYTHMPLAEHLAVHKDSGTSEHPPFPDEVEDAVHAWVGE